MKVPLYWLNADVGGSLIGKGHHCVPHFFIEILLTYTVLLYVNFLLMQFHMNFSNRILLGNAYLSK
jgi:hypothetical protein